MDEVSTTKKAVGKTHSLATPGVGIYPVANNFHCGNEADDVAHSTINSNPSTMARIRSLRLGANRHIRHIGRFGAGGDHLCVVEATTFIVVVELDPTESHAADGRTFMLARRKVPSEFGKLKRVILRIHGIVGTGGALAGSALVLFVLDLGEGGGSVALRGLGGVAAVVSAVA